MKKLLIIILFFSFINCDKNPFYPDEKFFSPEKLPLLSLDSLEIFWQGDSITHISQYLGEIFKRHPGFLDVLHYGSVHKKALAVSVFKSQNMAIDAMEKRIDDVQAVIKPGGSNEIIKEKWWYIKWLHPEIFIHKHNTIVEAYIIAEDYEKVKNLLMETTLEIARRVDSLSE